MSAKPAHFQRDVATAIRKTVRRYGKNYEPPDSLRALDKLQISQSTIAAALQAESKISVKSYQVSEWLRGTAPCPTKYHEALFRVLEIAVDAANSALRDAKKSGRYPLAALEHYGAQIRDAEQLLRAGKATQVRLV